MRLIELSANKKSFKTVQFKNHIGLNIIVAKIKNPEQSKKGDTTNGVGKSLSISLIHFCLGSSSNKEFEEKLSGWIFKLKFSIKENEYIAERSTDNQKTIKLNGRELKQREFNLELQQLLFDIPENVSQLSFRSLLPFFIRPNKASYTEFKNPNAVKNDFQILITNAFLLGLDVILAESKFKLRKEKERIRKLVKELSDDRLLKDFFIGKRDIRLASQELDEQIKLLDNNLKNFEVAEDYNEIKIEADKIKRKLDKIQNQIILYKNQIENIEESRKISPDIKKENIEKIYKEATVIIKKESIKQLSELEKFYQHITVNREKRLLLQKNEFIRKIEDLTIQKEEKGNSLDEKLKYLDTHQALDIFVKLTNKLSELTREKENINNYNNLLKGYSEEKLRINESFINETKKTTSYLSEAEETINSLMLFFRELSKRFYPNSAAGITVYNNDGDNQLRYNFDAKIEADASDGINSVKIFCYDLTILLQGFAHSLNFIYHDSRLLDGIDPRQKAELFLILNDLIEPNGKQYILSLNQNQLDDTRNYLTDEEYKTTIESNIILQLKDDSPEDKLLGIQVDLHYEK
ncbi:MAG: DUF2326 domain-containing protein [Melioribacteraceae bacterium]|nr:DUF2326 domain-containing protein [Melioribacteraceae bacterium]